MQFRKGLVVIALLFFSMTLGAGLAQTNLLSNGSFESPAAPAGSYTLVSTGQNLIPGWSVVGASGNVAVVSGTFSQYGYNFPAQYGSQWLDLTGSTNTATGVQQTVSTTAGTTYELSFWVGNVVGGGIFGTTSTVNVLVNGTQILAAKNTGGTTTLNWQQFKISFMATGSTTTIEFLNGDPPADTSNALDNVVLIKVTKDDLLGTWDGQGVYFRNSETGIWTSLTSPADVVACGDLYGDGKDDLIGIWSGQAWVQNSADGSWSHLAAATRDVAAGDMNGDGRVDFVGTWDGQGVYYKDSMSGAWVQMTSPAEKITAGDLDGDGKADLIGIWTGQGLWVKYSKTGTWGGISYTAPRDFAVGDMNGDGRVDFLGTWDGQGVYYKDSVSGVWVELTSPAEQVTAGDLDGDGTDDLIGIWTGQGIWAKYSKTGTWVNITTSARDIAAGKLSGGAWSAGLGSPIELMGPAGGYKENPGAGSYRDLSDQGPWGRNFTCRVEKNLTPQESESRVQRIPGPGEPGFNCIKQENLLPGERSAGRAEKKKS